jgi:hypothetical protein
MLLEHDVAYPATRIKQKPGDYRRKPGVDRFGPYAYRVVRVNVVLTFAMVVFWSLAVVRNISLLIFGPYGSRGFNAIVLVVLTLYVLYEMVIVSARPLRYPDARFALLDLPLRDGTAPDEELPSSW